VGLAYEANATIIGAETGGQRIEDGQSFSYPSTIVLKIEGRSNWFVDVRVVDGVCILEGRDLNGPGLTLAALYRRVLIELREHAELIRLNNEADAVNGVVFNGRIVPVVGCEAGAWFHRETVFAIVAPSGRSRWFGNNARDALSNAAPFLREQPTSIELEQGAAS
jgi:hypothetical protein